MTTLSATPAMTAEQWNEQHPIGTPVVAYPGARPEDFPKTARRVETTTSTRAWTTSFGKPVVMVNGHGAWVAVTHVDVVDRQV